MMQSFSMRRRRRSRSVGISRSASGVMDRRIIRPILCRQASAGSRKTAAARRTVLTYADGFPSVAKSKGNPVPRPILAESQIHPAVREKIANYRTDIVKEVQAAVAANDIVVVGMRQN